MPEPLDPDLLPHNALLLDLQMQVLSCSEGARALLAANSQVLSLHRGRLLAQGQPHAVAEQLRCGQSLTLLRKGRPSLTLLAQIVTDSQDQPLAVLATLVDPMNQRMDRRLLPGLFGLTTTEARIAAALADGQGTHQIAAELGVQLNTVHAHVKKLLAKTHTQRQVQLVSLLWRSVSVLTAHPPRLSMSDLLPPELRGSRPGGMRLMPIQVMTRAFTPTRLRPAETQASSCQEFHDNHSLHFLAPADSGRLQQPVRAAGLSPARRGGTRLSFAALRR